jgi:uncharacterized delta-60 repeat protein
MKQFYLIAFMISSLCATAQPGTLDPNFGSGGKLTTPIGSGNDNCTAILKLSTGKLLAAGGTTGTMAFARYNSDGTLDMTFNGSGTMTYDFETGNEAVSKLIEQPDGKIIAVGSATGTKQRMAVLRMFTDGTIDTAFGTQGEVALDFGTAEGRGTCVLLQPDGKIVVGGMARGASIYKMAVARLNDDGTFDTDFSGDGMQTTVLFGQSEYINGIALQPDGKIVAGGGTIASGSGNFAVVRYLPNGTLDTTFSDDGIVNFLPAGAGVGRDLLLQSDGKILIGGYAAVAGNGQDFALARLWPDGTLDDTFGTGGKTTTSVSTSNDWIFALALQPDGKIVGIGDALITATYYDFALVRYLPTGALDTAFGTNGIVTTDFNAALDRGFCGTIDGDGLIVAGVSTVATEDFALARYDLDIELGVTHNNPPQLALWPNPATDVILLQRDDTGPMPFSITDVLGKRVLSGTLVGDRIEVDNLERGIYFLAVGSFVPVKFIKR